MGASLSSLSSIRRTCQRLRNEMTPDAPRDVAGIQRVMLLETVMARHGMDDRQPQRPFYRGCVIQPNYEFAVFASETIVEAVLKSEVHNNLHVDGTFRVRPNGRFDQLLVIHWEHRGQSWPFIFVLMVKRTQAAYIALWRYVEENIGKLRPETFMSDYEVSLRSSIRSQYPSCVTSGCYFHFCQAEYEKAAKIGLTKTFKGMSDVRTLFMKFLRLPLLPANKIEEAYSLLLVGVPTDEKCWSDFLTYFQKQWLEKEGPANISVYGRLHRTNNLVESHNSRLREILPPSGNFYKFINGICRETGRKADDL